MRARVAVPPTRKCCATLPADIGNGDDIMTMVDDNKCVRICLKVVMASSQKSSVLYGL
jgi:hypothetical protein